MNKDTIGTLLIGIMLGIILTFILLWIYTIISQYGISSYHKGVVIGLFGGAALMACLDRIDWSIYGNQCDSE